ncbi:hypothetical protein BGW41_005533 [Actinomortierella wolfii]|nr:hypothetical protein BGW41_005533 [Actinomortierella wolfii]
MSSLPYELSSNSCIGIGGYGTVHLARENIRYVAVKVFRFTAMSSADNVSMNKEINMLSKLRDTHIIQFYYSTFYNGELHLVMEFAEGGSLRGAIERRRLDWPAKERIAQEIIRGLAYIHRENIWHRDLKSPNVLLTKHMEAKLCDFGLATVKTNSRSRTQDTESTLHGTLRWMAPELLGAKPRYSTKSDMYALGMVMWEMAADCTVPFKDYVESTVVVKLVMDGKREQIPDKTPDGYREWIMKCWEHKPEDRPEAKEMLAIEDRPLSSVCAALAEVGTPVNITSDETRCGLMPKSSVNILKAPFHDLPNSSNWLNGSGICVAKHPSEPPQDSNEDTEHLSSGKKDPAGNRQGPLSKSIRESASPTHDRMDPDLQAECSACNPEGAGEDTKAPIRSRKKSAEII